MYKPCSALVLVGLLGALPLSCTKILGIGEDYELREAKMSACEGGRGCEPVLSECVSEAENITSGTPVAAQVAYDCKILVCDGHGRVRVDHDDGDVHDDDKECTIDSCAGGEVSHTPAEAGTPCSQNGGLVCNMEGECVPCLLDDHCSPPSVCQQNKCVTPHCINNVLDDSESDVDCGGADCGPCAPAKACMFPSDCDSEVCTNNVCQAPKCDDSVKNGKETDVDCGGSSECDKNCPECENEKSCLGNSDCKSKYCVDGKCHASCYDSLKNGDETDKDCGGSCPPCEDGASCKSKLDCRSVVCEDHKCVGTPCSNGVLNDAETDVDCGGPTCLPCGNCDHCGSDSDCASGVCEQSWPKSWGLLCSCSKPVAELPCSQDFEVNHELGGIAP